MKRLLFVSLALCLTISASAQSKQNASQLPVIDITKDYPEKKIVLQDVATAEYIRLETTDEVLLDGVATIHCSFTDHYITTYNAKEGQIFVFDRKGKIRHTFNHKGGSGEEYNYPMQVRLDEKAKEIFLVDVSNKIQVYSIDGKYKRTLSVPKDVRIEMMFNCDDKYLLCYDSYMLDRKDKQPNSRPYILVSKKDGTISRLPVTVHNRVGNRTYVEKDGQVIVTSMNVYPIANSGSEFILADLAADTVYSYCNHKLTPLFVRTPKANASEPRLLMQCYAKIGKYLFMSTALKQMDLKKSTYDSKGFVYDMEEKKVYDLDFMNQDRSPARPLMFDGLLPELPEKCVYDSWDAERLMDMLEKGMLAGKMKSEAEKVSADDNPLLILYKFK